MSELRCFGRVPLLKCTGQPSLLHRRRVWLASSVGGHYVRNSVTNAYRPGNNRLVSSSIGSATEPFRYDAHGNTTALPHLPVMRWNHEDQLCATSKQVVLNGGTPETTYYVYDSAGRRIRKVTAT
ncbi:hypothetical protein DL98DRAFT_122813 [Cadophora sp. DSE1049]|nr:hypothetical protein DL98DRAFT_122813 [Cadophora sp. DSE1049]